MVERKNKWNRIKIDLNFGQNIPIKYRSLNFHKRFWCICIQHISVVYYVNANAVELALLKSYVRFTAGVLAINLVCPKFSIYRFIGFFDAL